jgi:aryl-alcohol dehydrogenase-like predicted oxidoreductase
MGGWSDSDDKQSLEALQLSVDLGCNCFDTAWAYGEGKSDGLLGQTTSGRTNGPTSLISARRWRNSNAMASSAISG